LPAPAEIDYVIPDFHFSSGEALRRLRMHYATFETPVRDAKGKVTNAVLLLHGTSGTGEQFLAPQFAGVLFGPGQPLDVMRYCVILPDNIGQGKSSKPSDGLNARFPQYDYNDMVVLQYEMLEQGLGVNHLRLILGTSMGCMHSWVWGESFPDFMDANYGVGLSTDADRGSQRSRLEERRLYFSASCGNGDSGRYVLYNPAFENPTIGSLDGDSLLFMANTQLHKWQPGKPLAAPSGLHDVQILRISLSPH
jgi:homoserine acetyltransferase